VARSGIDRGPALTAGDGAVGGSGPGAAALPVPVALGRLERLYGTLAPGAFGLAWAVARLGGAPAAALRARAGFLPPAAPGLVWCHGASAGEMAAALALIEALAADGVQVRAGYTTTNRAGSEYVRRVAGPAVPVALAPWDVRRWVERALAAWQPALLLLVETEIWPQWIAAAARRGIPVFLVSARLYPRDVARYRLIRPLLAPTLRRVTGFLAQNETERERFVHIGAPPDRCVVAGNLKHLLRDGLQPGGAIDLRAGFGLGAAEPVIVCGSLHRDEVGTVVDAMGRVAVPGVRWIVAPRHREATAELVRRLRRCGLAMSLRSAGVADGAWRVLVLDTMGELAAAYAVAAVAVVGGGFARHGGHNPIEPVRAGAPVVIGPHFDHFAAEGIALRMATPEAQVVDAMGLAAVVTAWLRDPARRAAVLARQRAALPDPAHVAATYRALLGPWLAERSG